MTTLENFIYENKDLNNQNNQIDQSNISSQYLLSEQNEYNPKILTAPFNQVSEFIQ